MADAAEAVSDNGLGDGDQTQVSKGPTFEETQRQ